MVGVIAGVCVFDDAGVILPHVDYPCWSFCNNRCTVVCRGGTRTKTLPRRTTIVIKKKERNEKGHPGGRSLGIMFLFLDVLMSDGR